MRFVRYRINQENRLGYIQAGYVVDTEAALEHFGFDRVLITDVLASPVETLALDSELLPVVQALAEKSGSVLEGADFVQSAEELEFLPPVTNPGKVICVGLNYPPPQGSHEWDVPEYPVLFHKAASALTGYQQPVVIPKISQEVEYEGELAVVIGRRAKQIGAESALEYVAGYTVANDVGARDVQRRASQWTSGKMFDTFCPLGPALVTVDEVPRPGDLNIKTRLNDEVVQDSSTDQMIFNLEVLVSYISVLTTLLPGDIILTGSPKNIGDQSDPRTLLQPGDVISVEIENLGVLVNPVIAEE